MKKLILTVVSVICFSLTATGQIDQYQAKIDSLSLELKMTQMQLAQLKTISELNYNASLALALSSDLEQIGAMVAIIKAVLADDHDMLQTLLEMLNSAYIDKRELASDFKNKMNGYE